MEPMFALLICSFRKDNMTLKREDFMSKALKDPGMLFSDPREVIENPWLTPEQKAKILEVWEQDQVALMRAEDEYMVQNDKRTSAARLLQKIVRAKEDLPEDSWEGTI
jgi:hypothetical protein